MIYTSNNQIVKLYILLSSKYKKIENNTIYNFYYFNLFVLLYTFGFTKKLYLLRYSMYHGFF